MKLIGSRNLNIHNENSDYDYVIIEDREDIINERLSKKSHCYHYPKEYRKQVALFNVDDFRWIFNAEDYQGGIIDINPFDFYHQWIYKLSHVNLFDDLYFNKRFKSPRKLIYHIVYNVEVIKAKSFELDEDALNRVKEWHDGKKKFDDIIELSKEINSLTK